jgi:hypothetical protein
VPVGVRIELFGPTGETGARTAPIDESIPLGVRAAPIGFDGGRVVPLARPRGVSIRVKPSLDVLVFMPPPGGLPVLGGGVPRIGVRRVGGSVGA